MDVTGTVKEIFGFGEYDYTEEGLLTDPEWIEAARTVHEYNNPGQSRGMTEKDYAEWGMSTMSWFNHNMAKMAVDFGRMQGADEKTLNAMNHLITKFDETEPSTRSRWTAVGAMALDPLNLLGIGTVLKLGAKPMSGLAVKHVMGNMSESFAARTASTTALGAAEGAAFSAADAAIREDISSTAEKREFDTNKVTQAAVAGTMIGGPLGALGPAAVAGGKKVNAIFRGWRPDQATDSRQSHKDTPTYTKDPSEAAEYADTVFPDDGQASRADVPGNVAVADYQPKNAFILADEPTVTFSEMAEQLGPEVADGFRKESELAGLVIPDDTSSIPVGTVAESTVVQESVKALGYDSIEWGNNVAPLDASIIKDLSQDLEGDTSRRLAQQEATGGGSGTPPPPPETPALPSPDAPEPGSNIVRQGRDLEAPDGVRPTREVENPIRKKYQDMGLDDDRIDTIFMEHLRRQGTDIDPSRNDYRNFSIRYMTKDNNLRAYLDGQSEGLNDIRDPLTRETAAEIVARADTAEVAIKIWESDLGRKAPYDDPAMNVRHGILLKNTIIEWDKLSDELLEYDWINDKPKWKAGATPDRIAYFEDVTKLADDLNQTYAAQGSQQGLMLWSRQIDPEDMGRAMEAADPGMPGAAPTGETALKRMYQVKLMAGPSMASKNEAIAKASSLKRFGDRLAEWWYSAILSSPETAALNLSSNWLVRLHRMIEDGSVVAIGNMRQGMHRLGGGSGLDNRMVAGQLAAQLRGYASTNDYTFKTIFRRTWDIAMDPEKVLAQDKKALKWMETIHDSVMPRWMRPLRLGPALMSATDVIMKQKHFHGKKAEMIWRQVYDSGEVPGTAQFVAKEAYLDMNTPKWMSDAAEKYAQEMTFSADPESKIAKALLGISNHPVGRFFVPFVRVVSNLTHWSIQRTPLVALSPSWVRDMRAGGVARDRAVSKGIQASALFGVIWDMVIEEGTDENGDPIPTPRITGAGPGNRELRKQWEKMEWRPYSFRIGDTYVSYDGLDPISMPLAIAASFAESMYGTYNEKVMEDQIMAGIMSLTEPLFDKTYAKALGDTLDMIRADTDPVPRIAGLVSGFVPYSALLNRIGKTFRDEKTNRKVSGDFLDALWNRVQMDVNVKVPGWNNVPAMTAWDGEIVKHPTQVLPYAVRLYTSSVKPDKATNELLRNAVPVSDPDPSFRVELSGVNMEYDMLQHDPSGESYLEYRKMVGQMRKKAVSQLIVDPEYTSLLETDTGFGSNRALMLANAISQARRDATELWKSRNMNQIRRYLVARSQVNARNIYSPANVDPARYGQQVRSQVEEQKDIPDGKLFRF